MHYQTQAGFYGLEPPAPGLTDTTVLTLTLVGDVERPSSYTMRADTSQIGDFVVIGDNTWTRRDNSPHWVQQPTADIGLGPVNPLGIAAYMRYYKPTTPHELGTETVDGTLLHHLRFDVDTQRMLAETNQTPNGAPLTQSNLTADVWIRDTDHLLDHLSLAVDAAGKGIIIRTTLSNYDIQLTIDPPTDLKP